MGITHKREEDKEWHDNDDDDTAEEATNVRVVIGTRKDPNTPYIVYFLSIGPTCRTNFHNFGKCDVDSGSVLFSTTDTTICLISICIPCYWC